MGGGGGGQGRGAGRAPRDEFAHHAVVAAAVAGWDLTVGADAALMTGSGAAEEVVDVNAIPITVKLASGAEDAGLAGTPAGEAGHRQTRGGPVLVAQRDHLVVDDVVVARPHAAPVGPL